MNAAVSRFHISHSSCTGLVVHGAGRLAILTTLVLFAGCVANETQYGSASSSSGGKLAVWVVSDMVALTDRTKKFTDNSILANDKDRNTVNLFAAGNETLSFQIVIDAPAAGMRSVKISPGALFAGQPGDKDTPTISAANIQAFRMLPVRVTKFPAWYLRLIDKEPEVASFYDPLVPVNAPQGGQPYAIKGGQRLAVWVDVSIPRSASPGLYRGKIKISAELGNVRELNVELKVHDFVLPDAQPIAVVGAFDHRTIFRTFVTHGGRPYEPEYLDFDNPKAQEGLEIIRQMMLLSHAHRLDLFDRQLRPKIRRDLHGQLGLDWSDYDRIAGPYISGEAFDDQIASPAWPIPYCQDWPVPKYYGGIRSPSYAATASGLISQCVRHFRGPLKSEEQIFAWPYRGEVSASAFGQYARLARIIRKADRTLPILTQLPTKPPAMTGWEPPKNFAALVDILAPPAQWLNPSRSASLRTPKNPLMGVWLSPGLPPYLPSLSVIATPADVRAIPWFAMKYNCSGLFLPEVLNWSGDVFNTPAGAQTRLFYPGKAMGIRGVLPSVRLKRLRRGLQDIAYVWILRQRQHGKIAQAILDSMVRYAGLAGAGDNYLDPRIAGWLQHGPTWMRARKLLTDEVLLAVHQKVQTPQQKIAEKVRWRHFSDHAHSLRVQRVGAQMSYGHAPARAANSTPDPTGKPWRATILVDMYNEYDRPLDCLLEVTSLPKGWKGLIARHRILNFPPGGQRIAKLVVEGMQLPITANGKIPVELKLTTNVPSEILMRTSVPFIHTDAFRQKPVIDGKLDDWPRRPATSGGDFRLLGRRGEIFSIINSSIATAGQGTKPLDDDPGLAKRKTVAFAMVDEKNLYFAIRCEEPNLAGMKFNNSNTIHYEQLLACGEDLVEIVLDPGAKAKGPEGLYHIIVKPNGVMIEEKGIRSNPPLGKASPLPLGTTVAVGRQEKAWVVEMKIPRCAFGPAGREVFWGVNFMRFATQGMEASSWSGASRYFYDPETLGTIFVMQPDKK